MEDQPDLETRLNEARHRRSIGYVLMMLLPALACVLPVTWIMGFRRIESFGIAVIIGGFLIWGVAGLGLLNVAVPGRTLRPPPPNWFNRRWRIDIGDMSSMDVALAAGL